MGRVHSLGSTNDKSLRFVRIQCVPAVTRPHDAAGKCVSAITRPHDTDGKCGLNINKGKSNVLLFNHDEIRLEEVGGIRVSNTIRYLGAVVGDSRMYFRAYRKG